MKPISPTVHGVLDYVTAAALLMAPYYLLKPGSAAMLFSYAVGILQFLLAFFTRYPLGAVKWLPFRTHGYIEVGVAIVYALIGLGLLSQGAKFAFGYYIVLTAIYFLVFFLTDFRSQSADKKVYER